MTYKQIELLDKTSQRNFMLKLRWADGFLTRARGLLFAARLSPLEGIWITKCSSVHTFFMAYAIDVVFLDADNKIISVTENLKPWRAAWCVKAKSVIEINAGQYKEWGFPETIESMHVDLSGGQRVKV